jgi:hypothetical protein
MNTTILERNAYSVEEAIRYLNEHNLDVFDLAYYQKSFTQKAMYKTGKQFKTIKSFIAKPEVKATVLIANWSASAALLILTMIFTASPAVFVAALFIFVVETYAVLGTAEYAISYGMALRMQKGM